MQSLLFLSACFVAQALAQAVPEGIAPSSKAPPGCQVTYDGNFTLGIGPAASSRIRRAQTAQLESPAVTVALKNGVLKDTSNRIGAIVANHQFQFDGPPQAGSIYTGGWSVCKNGSLALGDSTVLYKCRSGDFYNLYDQNVADQCEIANIVISPVNKPSSSSSSSAASSTDSKSASASASDASASSSSSASASASASVSASRNATISTGSPSGSNAAKITSTPTAASGAGSKAPSSTGAAAIATRAPRRETFGAVVGILGAAFLL